MKPPHMNHALYPISGDPPTWGHASVLQRAALVFAKVTWAAAINPGKRYLCPLEERQKMMQDYVEHLGLSNVEVSSYTGATALHAQQIQANVIVKGLRGAQDLPREMEQAFGNALLAQNVHTVFFLSLPEHLCISSSLARELLNLGQATDALVLPAAAQRARYYLNQQPSE